MPPLCRLAMATLLRRDVRGAAGPSTLSAHFHRGVWHKLSLSQNAKAPEIAVCLHRMDLYCSSLQAFPNSGTDRNCLMWTPGRLVNYDQPTRGDVFQVGFIQNPQRLHRAEWISPPPNPPHPPLSSSTSHLSDFGSTPVAKIYRKGLLPVAALAFYSD